MYCTWYTKFDLAKFKEKELAIALRKEGKTYNEILEIVPVAKSTLSLWLREVGLSKSQKQKLTAKKRSSQLRGGARRHEMRLEEERVMLKRAINDVGLISDRDLFLIGVALYWAEGAKRNADKPGVMIDFGNSDPEMLKLFIAWLRKFAGTKDDEIVLRLHLHINHAHREEELKKLWSSKLNMPQGLFKRTVYKKHNPKTVRHKIGKEYIGLVSLRVKRSTSLNRRIIGLIYAIIAAKNK